MKKREKANKKIYLLVVFLILIIVIISFILIKQDYKKKTKFCYDKIDETTFYMVEIVSNGSDYLEIYLSANEIYAYANTSISYSEFKYRAKNELEESFNYIKEKNVIANDNMNWLKQNSVKKYENLYNAVNEMYISYMQIYNIIDGEKMTTKELDSFIEKSHIYA